MIKHWLTNDNNSVNNGDHSGGGGGGSDDDDDGDTDNALMLKKANIEKMFKTKTKLLAFYYLVYST